MKKIRVVSVTAWLLAVFAAVCLVGCGSCSSCSSDGDGEYSETFVGAVSVETYASAQEAVKGFLETEISGKTVEAVFVDYKKEAELSKKEVEELPIEEEYRDGLISVERGTVEYKEKSVSSLGAKTLADRTAEERRERTVFILTYTDMFRFFVPEQKEGETLSMSYYDSVFDGEKYINCTMNATITNEYTDEDGKKVVVKNDALSKATKTALYELDSATYTKDNKTETAVREGYNFDDTLKLYSDKRGYVDFETIGIAEKYDNDEWLFAYDVYEYGTDENGDFIGFYEGSINDHFMEWFDERFGQLDHTFFEKTDTGYALRTDKYAEYVTIYYPDASITEYDLEYIINIKDGRMADFTMRIAYNDVTATMSCVFSALGTTEIGIPDEIISLAEKEKTRLLEKTEQWKRS